MTVEIFTEESLFNGFSNKNVELKALANEFKAYKENKAGLLLGFNLGNPYFGKDEKLTQPPVIRGILQKVHFKPDTPKKAKVAWSTSIRKGHIPTSDHVLLYAQGKTNLNKYLLIDIFKPDGHKKMKDFAKLVELKKNFADPFRETF